MNSLLLEPLRYYELDGKERHRENLMAHFDKLVSESSLNEDENRDTVKLYSEELVKVEKQKKLVNRYRRLKTFVIFMTVVLVSLFCISLFTGLLRGKWIAIFAPITVLIVILAIFLVKKKLNPKIKKNEEILAELEEKARGYYNQAMAQMSKLNSLFRAEDTFRIIEETLPGLDFDNRLSTKRLSSLMQDFDYLNQDNSCFSVTDMLSGEYHENPFIFERGYRMQMGTATYTGTLPISWTETYRDSKGNTRRRRRSQILHASLVKPKPYYKLETQLGYGSQAAPDLSFSRMPSHTEDLSEGELERKVKRGGKKLRKRTEKAVETGDKFQVLGNVEFDVLFGATNRNHEVQFRFLFTPLAQKNTLDLLTSETGYGDDFAFAKYGKFNVIHSEHSQAWQMYPSAERYRSHSVDLAREAFISYNEEYFKSVFFDFAPLWAVPAYQDPPAESMKTPLGFESCYPPEEHEALANAIGESYFRHPNSATQAILKTTLVSSSENVDRVAVTAHSFETANRIDYVPVWGGDGRMHPVPVPWLDYIPIENTREIALSALDTDRKDFYEKNSTLPECNAYFHGIFAFPVEYSEPFDKIGNVFKGLIK